MISRRLHFTGGIKKLNYNINLIHHAFLCFCCAVFAFNQNACTVLGLAVASIFWLVTELFPKIFPADKPTKLEAEINALKAQIEVLDKTVLTNAQYSATEFGTIKTAMQIRQLGR